MSKPNASFYNLAWRWHFYAGLFVAPFMILLAITGIIYLFKPQLDPLMYRDLMVVEAGHHRQRRPCWPTCARLIHRGTSASTCRRWTPSAARSSWCMTAGAN
jgi:uncharacterized iron-regulated membrane protein